MPPAVSAKGLRNDIQALRGVAVLLVLLYHAHLGAVEGGYLGVDIFFVISGFLITGLITSGIERQDFRLSTFYFRRAKRLLPAAYVTFLVTALLAPFFLGASQLRDFAKQMLGAVSFSANIAMWQQTGYFDGSADSKPLLHVWSLSLEEQYYFLLPATLLFVAKRHWLRVAIAALLVSAALCAGTSRWFPSATFYLLPTRAWELGLGSIGALIGKTAWASRSSERVVWIAVALIILVPVFPIGGPHPGWDALIVCLSTLIIILAQNRAIEEHLATAQLARVGDFSYSLYLVHWPIFSFATNTWAGDSVNMPLGIRLGGMALALLLGFAMFRLVETPARHSNIRLSAKFVTATLTASVGLITIPFVSAAVIRDRVDYGAIRDWNFGFGIECDHDGTFVPMPKCQTADNPKLLVWGDSYAMQIVAGIAATAGDSPVAQATKSVCGPLLRVAPVSSKSGSSHNLQWARECVSFNDEVLKYLERTPSIEVVVVSSRLSHYLGGTEYRTLVAERGHEEVRSVSPENVLRGLHRTVQAIRAMGKKVVLVAPAPASGFNVGACLERRAQGKLVFGAPPSCMIDLSAYQTSRAKVLDVLRRSEQEIDVPVFRFDPFLCNSSSCATELEGTFLYRDADHFSRVGSLLIGKKLNLATRLSATAR
jgi:peptidoglycan/LPS O-acetylase OafA/YrhL